MLADVDHVGIAVEDLDAAVERYRRIFGLQPAHREIVQSQGVEEVLFRLGTSYVQLLGRAGAGHAGRPVPRAARAGRPPRRVPRGRRGGGAERLRAEGVRLVDEAPRAGSRGTTIAFVHPRDLGGVLVELVQEG